MAATVKLVTHIQVHGLRLLSMWMQPADGTGSCL